ncbi:hypothetical protein ACMHYB_60090 [Sorangium sp. So ce1128]
MRRLHDSPRTEEAYVVHWIRQFIGFQSSMHARQMGAEEVTALLNGLERACGGPPHRGVHAEPGAVRAPHADAGDWLSQRQPT